MVEFRILREGGQNTSSQPLISGEQTSAPSGVCLGESHRIRLWAEWRELRKLVSIQGSLPTNSRELHPREYEVRQKCHYAYVQEQGAPNWTQAYTVGKKGGETWKEYKNIVQASRNEVRETKVQMELNLTTAVRDISVVSTEEEE